MPPNGDPGYDSITFPDRWVPMEAVTVWKCLDENGVERLYLTVSPGLSQWEAAGMGTYGADSLRMELLVDEEEAGAEG